jgi:hypothetical protein
VAAPAAALVGGDSAAGAVKQVLKALEHNIISFKFERDPKNFKKMRLVSMEFNVTTGLILGTAALGLAWEVGMAFANSGLGGGTAGTVGDLTSLVTLNPFEWLVTDLFGNAIVDENGKQKTVKIPQTFGATFNQMLRNATAAGPGQLAQTLLNLVANATTGGGPNAPKQERRAPSQKGG